MMQGQTLMEGRPPDDQEITAPAGVIDQAPALTGRGMSASSSAWI